MWNFIYIEFDLYIHQYIWASMGHKTDAKKTSNYYTKACTLKHNGLP